MLHFYFSKKQAAKIGTKFLYSVLVLAKREKPSKNVQNFGIVY